MNFTELERRIEDTKLWNELKTSSLKINLAKVEQKSLLKTFSYCLEKGKVVGATNCFFLSWLLCKEELIEKIKNGLLRCTRFISKKYIVGEVLSHIIPLSNELNMKNQDIVYLEDLKKMSSLYKYVFNAYQELIKELKFNAQKFAAYKNPTSLIRTLLVFAEFQFYKEFDDDFKDKATLESAFPKEKILEGISFLIYLINEKGIESSGVGFVDVEYIESGEINRLINLACLYKEIQYLEVDVERFGYHLTIKSNIVQIDPPSPEFEQSKNLGFIMTDLQRYYLLRQDKGILKDAKSLNDIVTMVFDKLKQSNIKMIEYTEDLNCPRFRLLIPVPVLEMLKKHIFDDAKLFVDEVNYLSEICKEQLVTVPELKALKVSSNLSVYDVLMLKRVLSFVQGLWLKNILIHEKKSLTTILNTLVPTGDFNWFKASVGPFASNEDALKEYIASIQYEIDSKRAYDMQYRPILKIGKSYHTLLNILVFSNTIRNLYSQQYKGDNPAFFKDGQDGGIPQLLCKTFASKYFEVRANIVYTFEGEHGEIDFLAVAGGCLLVAECKETLYPINNFELRTYYDYLLKAKQQLDKLSTLLKKDEFRKALSQKIGFDITRCKIIQTTIITNCRVFQWSNIFGHPIRTIHDVCNFMEKGTARTEDGVISLWANKDFSIDDLIAYLGPSFNLHRIMFESMVEGERIFKIGNLEIKRKEYGLNQDKCREELRRFQGHTI